jgi:hypothetical protein
MAKTSLRCHGYQVNRQAGMLTTIHADFIIPISPHDIEKMSDALKNIEVFLSGAIDLVKADETKPRCFYCGTLNDLENNVCSQCGASL